MGLFPCKKKASRRTGKGNGKVYKARMEDLKAVGPKTNMRTSRVAELAAPEAFVAAPEVFCADPNDSTSYIPLLF